MLTTKHRVELILLSACEGMTHRRVVETFNSTHSDMNVSHTTVGRLLNKFKETGSVHDSPCSGHPTVNDEKRQFVIDKVTNSPMKSVRRSSQEIGIARSTMRDILKQEHFHPYKLLILHKLTEDDPDRRLEMCHWLLEHPMLCRDMLFSDEANFYVNGEVNKQNCWYYSQSNPHWTEACREHSSAKIMVWCGLWKKHVLGPFFFSSNLTGSLSANVTGQSLTAD